MKKILFYVLCLMLVTSCAQEAIETNKEGQEEARVTVAAGFKLAVDGSMSIATRSSASVDSIAVKNLWVLQFAYGTGKLLQAPQYLDEKTDFSSSNIEVKLRSGASNIYFVANTFKISVFNSGNCATETAFKALSTKYTSDDIQGELANDKNCLPMTGSMLNENITTGSLVKTVDMERSVALIDLTYITDFIGGDDFTVEGIRVCNVCRNMWYGIPTEANFTSEAADDYCDYDLEMPSGGEQSGRLLFYVPENMKGQGAVNTQPIHKIGLDGKKCTYVEIRGHSNSLKRFGIYRIYPGADNVMDYNIKRNHRYAVDVTLEGLSLYDSRLLVAGFKPEANSYIVKPSTLIMIPVSIANTEAQLRGVANPVIVGTTEFTADMLWTDNPNGMAANGVIASVTPDPISGYLQVRTGTDTGNAVVYAKVDGNIIWSWHIWVTSYDPDATAGLDRQVYPYNGRTWMDRNLGAKTAIAGSADNLGFIYQWGRKDPFPCANAVSSTTTPITIYDKDKNVLIEGATGTGVNYGTVTSTNNIGNAIRYPLTFYITNNAPNDWCSTTTAGQKPNLWGGATTTASAKQVYDPCPPGWRVPVYNTVNPYIGLSTSNGGTWSNGYNWSSVGLNYFPAGGYRLYTNSALTNVGTRAYCWTGTISSTSAFSFVAYNGTILPANSDARALGCAVRCVKE